MGESPTRPGSLKAWPLVLVQQATSPVGPRAETWTVPTFPCPEGPRKWTSNHLRTFGSTVSSGGARQSSICEQVLFRKAVGPGELEGPFPDEQHTAGLLHEEPGDPRRMPHPLECRHSCPAM